MNTRNDLIDRVLAAYGHHMTSALTTHTATGVQPNTDDTPAAVFACAYPDNPSAPALRRRADLQNGVIGTANLEAGFGRLEPLTLTA